VAAAVAAHAVSTGKRQPAELRAWLLGRVQLHPSLLGRVTSGGWLPPNP
jgi:hypothetical protein